MEHSTYLNGIKRALKSRELSYKDLALSLRMTESGVKKMLNAKDISFRRVLQICEILNVLPGQLFSLSEQSSIPLLPLTPAQEEALLRDRKLLAVYWLFTIDRRTPEDIAAHQRAPLTDVKKALQKLVGLELVAQKRGRFLTKTSGKFRWPDDSKLARKLNEEWSVQTLKRALRAAPDEGLQRLTALKLSDAASKDFLRKLTALLDETVRLSEREELTSARKTLQDFTILIAAAKGGVLLPT